MIATQIDITDRLCGLRDTLSSAARMLEGMTVICMDEEADSRSIILAMATMTESATTDALCALDDITEWCRSTDVQRIEREVAVADQAESDDSRAIRTLSRDLARQIEQVCAPALQAITQMQNRAGEIDAMVQRARDMAGCFRPIHSAARDTNKPEVGSMREAVEIAKNAGSNHSGIDTEQEGTTQSTAEQRLIARQLAETEEWEAFEAKRASALTVEAATNVR